MVVVAVVGGVSSDQTIPTSFRFISLENKQGRKTEVEGESESRLRQRKR